MRSPLIAFGALCAIALLPSAVQAQTPTWTASTREAPELYWSKPRPVPPPFTTSTTEFDLEGTDGGFAYLEARPQADDDLEDGVWVTLLTRVTFWNLQNNTNIPPAVRTNVDLTSPPSYSFDAGHPDVIVSQTRFDALMAELTDDTDGDGVFDVVTERMQPFVTGSSAAATTARWNALYPHWPANSERAYWRSVDTPQSGQIFNFERMLADTITTQTGGVIDGDEFLYRWGQTAALDSQMSLEIQPLYVHGSSNDTFNNGPVPEGPTGGFKVGTSTPLAYTPLDFGTPPIVAKTYPLGVGHSPHVVSQFVPSGDGFEFDSTLIGLPTSVYVVLSTAGQPDWHDPNPWWVYKLSGQPPKIFTPAWVPNGTIIRLKQFVTPYGTSDIIPVADRDVFTVDVTL